jgi:hypothetical protein
MTKYCPNCGKEISEMARFCSSCGVDINSLTPKPEVSQIVGKPELAETTKIEGEKKEGSNIGKILLIAFGLLLLFAISYSFISGVLSGIRSGQSQSIVSPQSPASPQFIVVPTEDPVQRNIRIANQIVANYHQSHVYSLTDLYVCADMASDVWDMLKAQGINAKINVGNVDKDITSILDANHAWVMAEVSPNGYLALETTGGYSVQKADNPRYYFGWSFYNPKQLKEFTQLMQERSDAITKYNAALNDYNNFLIQYNNANIFTKLAWKSQLDNYQVILNQRTQDLNQINQQISTLLSTL